ncbi:MULTISPECIES: hypothetical protein [unclassified Pseudomonas]|uniref:hypothetical protein n=1 Tax=unclassified Pseudomonas TaxID=196821 RepID=UPI003264088D
MQIDPDFILLDTEHWQLNHHLASALPGYLMLGAKAPARSLAEMPEAALADGAELTLFVWREFGENPMPPVVQGPSVSNVMEQLRTAFRRQ